MLYFVHDSENINVLAQILETFMQRSLSLLFNFLLGKLIMLSFKISFCFHFDVRQVQDFFFVLHILFHMFVAADFAIALHNTHSFFVAPSFFIKFVSL